MSNELRILVENRLGESLTRKVRQHEEKGATWLISDEGIKLVGQDKMLLLLVRASIIEEAIKA